ncbi:hypothetical protein C8034_v004146 [Colletotrichum sidae]|uniref:Uncharacterized protein n=1 Tax=Colletotrichum sidae TaxID=1347389 RepID=A0A4R8S1W9_9PEZI|nr:hypothetical protein C8034_v004146 [Colletotrichum sidae]
MNYKNYNYFYKSLKGLILYKNSYTTFSSFLKIIITISSVYILLRDKTISRTKKNNIKVIKKNLAPKSKVFKDNFEYF